MTRTITGRTAILVAERLGVSLRKHADPTEGAREIDADEARRICAEDPSLVYVDSAEVAGAVDSERIVALRSEAATAGDVAQVRLCDAALDGDVAARVECVRALAEAWAQEDRP